MKFRSSPYRHSVAILGLLFVPLLPIGKAQAAASVTLENQGWFVASFELEGCGIKKNVGDIPLGQHRTVDLSAFDGCTIPVDLRVFYHYWGWQTFTGSQPSSLSQVKGGIWKLNGGVNDRTVTQSTIHLIMRGVAWEPEMELRNVILRDLAGFDLSGANLYRANLSWANLTGADLTGAYLDGANLTGADLCGANLYGANLTWADLSGANLTWADLTGAALRGASLFDANLGGVDSNWILGTDSTTICPNGSYGPCW